MTSILSHRVLSSTDGKPSQCIVFLHGILGTKANWTSIARKFIEQNPEWSAVLVDLRKHGESQGFTPPHTLDACAQDLTRLQQELPVPVHQIAGHSYGGKVALRWARELNHVRRVTIVDSNPGISGPTELRSEIMQVLGVLESAPQPLQSRRAFVDFAMGQGLSEPTARWLAMNVEEKSDHVHLKTDLGAIHELLRSYRETDCWPDVEAILKRSEIDLVIGGRSASIDAAGKERAQKMKEQHKNFHLHEIVDAGHWVHVDAPDELLRILEEG